MDSRGPVPARGGRRQEQPAVETGLVLLSQPRGGGNAAGQDLGLLVVGGEALVTTPGHLPGRRVLEPLPGVEEVVLGHLQPAGSVLAHAHHQPYGNAPDLEPLQLLTGDPGPEHP